MHNGTELKADSPRVAVSLRLAPKEAYRLYLYAEQMQTSAGKLLGSLLEDVLPTFTEETNTVTLRTPQLYKAMKASSLLRSVNTRNLEDRILKGMESGGPIGRPRKARTL